MAWPAAGGWVVMEAGAVVVAGAPVAGRAVAGEGSGLASTTPTQTGRPWSLWRFGTVAWKGFRRFGCLYGGLPLFHFSYRIIVLLLCMKPSLTFLG